MGTYTGELRWNSDVVTAGDAGVGAQVSGLVGGLKSTLIQGEDLYQELLELHTFAGGTDQLLADQLFAEQIALRSESQANTEEVAKTAAAIAAMLAAHQLYEAADNQVVAQSDRLATFRRMS